MSRSASHQTSLQLVRAERGGHLLQFGLLGKLVAGLMLRVIRPVWGLEVILKVLLWLLRGADLISSILEECVVTPAEPLAPPSAMFVTVGPSQL